MPLDAVCLSGVVRELQPLTAGLRVEKIQQPARDQIILSLRGNKRLLLCAGANQARIHLTSVPRENPAAPPMFCMLLRKHLSSAKLRGISQPRLERAAILSFDILDELGEPGVRKLVLECMGRYSNLILLDGQDRIIDCLRRVDMEMSEKRQVLPGLFYRLPPAQDNKADPLEITEDGFYALLDRAGDVPPDKFLLDCFFGLSPLVCRELAWLSSGYPEPRPEYKKRLWNSFSLWQDAVKSETFQPFLLLEDGKPVDFSYIPVNQYGAAREPRPMDSFSSMLDAFYETRDRMERARQKGHDLQKCAVNARDRLRRKLAAQEKEYAETQGRDKLRVRGELITANLYRMERGGSTLVCQDFYQEDCPEVSIPLDPLLSPQQNAARYFKLYNKAKTAEAVLSEQMEVARRERDWLESVLDELSRAESEQDFNDIRGELQAAGYLKPPGGRKKNPKAPPSRPREFFSRSGMRILVGRSNSQNDSLTKNADKRDYWFHTQRIHGSHVILCTEGREPDPGSLTDAASLAAWFSQGRESPQVAVDYTQVKNVRKPAGARPGMVIYDSYKTAYVHPEESFIHSLR